MRSWRDDRANSRISPGALEARSHMDTMVCPGCGEDVYDDPMDGWRNDNGLTCRGYTTHSEWIVG